MGSREFHDIGDNILYRVTVHTQSLFSRTPYYKTQNSLNPMASDVVLANLLLVHGIPVQNFFMVHGMFRFSRQDKIYLEN
jgi:hypothetical protein